MTTTTNGTPARLATDDEARAFLTAVAADPTLDDAPAGRTPRKARAPRKARTPAATPTTTTSTPATSTPPADPLHRWARAGVFLSLGLSGLLNGHANAAHCAEGMAGAGWGLGLCVPALVLILSRVAGGAWLRGRRGLGAAGGLVAVALLALSVRHCAATFAALTGADMMSAVLWAIGVDAGLVVCELATLNRKGK